MVHSLFRSTSYARQVVPSDQTDIRHMLDVSMYPIWCVSMWHDLRDIVVHSLFSTASYTKHVCVCNYRLIPCIRNSHCQMHGLAQRGFARRVFVVIAQISGLSILQC